MPAPARSTAPIAQVEDDSKKVLVVTEEDGTDWYITKDLRAFSTHEPFTQVHWGDLGEHSIFHCRIIRGTAPVYAYKTDEVSGLTQLYSIYCRKREGRPHALAIFGQVDEGDGKEAELTVSKAFEDSSQKPANYVHTRLKEMQSDATGEQGWSANGSLFIDSRGVLADILTIPPSGSTEKLAEMVAELSGLSDQWHDLHSSGTALAIRPNPGNPATG